jgi:hypothetical protein
MRLDGGLLDDYGSVVVHASIPLQAVFELRAIGEIL